MMWICRDVMFDAEEIDRIFDIQNVYEIDQIFDIQIFLEWVYIKDQIGHKEKPGAEKENGSSKGSRAKRELWIHSEK